MKFKIARSPIKSIILTSLLVGVVAIMGSQLTKSTSHAADIRNFDPGNIMSDIVMSSKDTMSVSDIQNFLNSKNYCDNQNLHMAGWYPHLQYNIKDGKFVCMARESFDGKSAAQLIWDTAYEFNINPQVLIVLLEKEQGLVTDTWPNHIQYRSATGFGCPDTAPCDTQYYGMKNQLRLAAKLFREVLDGGWSNYPVGQRYVQYHPNAACGGSIINIQNRATSALYRYTPYQPNQSALNAGYGTGDSCGAYGNRNFWRLFNDWFGDTQSSDTLQPHPDGSLVVINNRVYLVDSGKRHWISNGAVFESHNYSWGWIKKPTTGDKNLQDSWPIDTIAPGVLYRSDNSPIYVTVRSSSGGYEKKQISYNAFIAMGYRWDQVRVVNENELPKTTSSSILLPSDAHPDGTLVVVRDAVYMIDHSTLRHVSPHAFTSNGFKWSDVVQGTTIDAQLPIGARTLLRKGAPIRDDAGYYIVGIPPTGYETKHQIGPWKCYEETFGFSSKEALHLTGSSMPSQTSTRISC